MWFNCCYPGGVLSSSQHCSRICCCLPCFQKRFFLMLLLLLARDLNQARGDGKQRQDEWQQDGHNTNNGQRILWGERCGYKVEGASRARRTANTLAPSFSALDRQYSSGSFSRRSDFFSPSVNIAGSSIHRLVDDGSASHVGHAKAHAPKSALGDVQLRCCRLRRAMRPTLRTRLGFGRVAARHALGCKLQVIMLATMMMDAMLIESRC